MRLKKIISMIVIVFMAVCSYGQIEQSAAIDSIFAEWDKPGTPGSALGVIRDGELIYARGYGMANLEYDIPNSPTSVFRIGSTSKQFTAACIILLVEKGKLALDTPLNKIFPDFPDYAGRITVQHLLNHTSGIRDYLTLAYLAGLEDDDYYTDEDVMKWLVNQNDINFLPGDEYLYSNSGYWLLGQIMEAVSGENMADFARREIFEPLGMTDTHFHNDHRSIVKNRASGYMPDGEGGYRISMTTLDMIGDGGIFTTIEDMKKWDDAFYSSEIFSLNFWKMMTKQAVLNNGEELEYASGLSIGNYRGLKTVSHGGAFVGFRADCIRFPEQRFSVIVFANRGDANPTGMGYRVADVFLKDEYRLEKGTSGSTAGKPAHEFITLSSEQLEKYTGNYWNSERSYSREIIIKNDTLRYRRSENSESVLRPISENEFKLIGTGADIVVSFDTEEIGNRTLSYSVDGGKPVTLVSYTPVRYSTKELKRFSGSYYSEELDVIYDLRMKEDALVLYVNGRESSPLEPVMENVFTNDRYGAFTFKEDRKGKVDRFRLAAGRVKNLKFVMK